MGKKLNSEAVLAAAERLFAEKGFVETTISEIAKEAGVHETSVYAYFSNKKTLLFAIYARYIQNATITLNGHFKGMRDPGPKLRKAIWHYLDDMNCNRNHARLLMTGQRETSAFYESPYSDDLREYMRIISEIVSAAQADGIFRKDISVRLIRNMAMGAAVFSVFESVAHDRSYDPDDLSDIIYRLVVKAASPPSTPQNDLERNSRKDKTEYRRGRIIDTATRAFSSKGFLGSTISEIANMASLADGTLYDYFSTKEDLLLSIPEAFFKDLESRDTLFFPAIQPVEKALRKLIWRWIWLLWSKKDFARVLTLEIFRNIKFYSTPGYQCYQDYLEKISQVVRKGQDEGVFVKEVSLPSYLHMITGTTDQYLLSHFLLGRPMAEIPELNNIVDLLVRAVKVGDDG